MNKNALLLLFVVVLLSACGNTAKERSFTMKGTVTNTAYEGRIVYLKDAVSGTEVYDSVQIVHGKFTFAGMQDTAVVRELYVQENDSDNYPLTLPVVLENGEILVTLGNIVSVSNTPLNNDMMDFLMAKDRFMDKDFTGKEPDAVKKEFSEFLVTWIIKNAGSPVGKYIYEGYNSKLDEAQKEQVQKVSGW